MTNLSITLPDNIAIASSEAAKKLGVSRTEFIRQAVIHELSNFQFQTEQAGIIKSFAAMKKSKKYLAETTEITEALNSELPQEREKWWNKEI
ncbi:MULTISPECIES: ribbon-helix-helix domain-containing protein [unclassified Rickettsia]|uniref:ribbon-helix-helix domain-containing protein n=1 Tax=unclassified Rickettsia TaxID=114295 RepID=UPI0031330EDF